MWSLTRLYAFGWDYCRVQGLHGATGRFLGFGFRILEWRSEIQ